ncbi:IS3 family transposase, partial [Ectothiorhodospira shaposhnikovii]|nr:IS3 family transposase [Ectothiorhodospira shaposhnikovii]
MEVFMSKKARRRYTEEFKAEAVALVERQGYGVAEAARSLGINRSLLDRWLRKERERQSPQHDQQEDQ